MQRQNYLQSNRIMVKVHYCCYMCLFAVYLPDQEYYHCLDKKSCRATVFHKTPDLVMSETPHSLTTMALQLRSTIGHIHVKT